MTTEVDDYLAAVPEPARTALEDLRATIREVVPDATETISYQVPTFKYQDRPLVAYGANQSGCTFYVMSTDVFNAYKEQAKGYKSGKGSIRFEPDKPLPADLVQKIVKARISENTGRYR